MKNTVINIKTTGQTKAGAQKVAEELGFSLSSLINAYLKELVRTKQVNFSLSEEPTLYFRENMHDSQEDVKAGRVSPAFTNADDAIKWLNSP